MTDIINLLKHWDIGQVIVSSRSHGKSDTQLNILLDSMTEIKTPPMLSKFPYQQEMMAYYTQNMIIGVDYGEDRLLHMPSTKEKDWESKIPHPDPFARKFSSPSLAARKRARARRKK